MAELALWLWLLYFLVSFALRVLVQSRRTGRTGVLLMRARPGSLQWWAEAAEALALALGVAAAVLADEVEPIEALDGSGAHVTGVALYAAGLAGVVASQEAMGASWRIGQDAGERTELVTRGPFALVRNPIFTSLVAVQAGLALLVPSVIAVAGLVLMVGSVVAQARLVEEPHLLRVHGSTYADYMTRTGRFLPRLRRK